MLNLTLEEKELIQKYSVKSPPDWFEKRTPVHTGKECDDDGFFLHWPLLYPGGYDFDYALRPYYDWMLKKQNGVCAICKRHRLVKTWNRMHVDHNHATKEIRGVLCGWCNSMIGLAGSDLCFTYPERRNPIENLRSAIKYLSVDRIDYPVYTYSFRRSLECSGWRKRVGYKCEICNDKETVSTRNKEKTNKLTVDHDHLSGCVRGLLCTRCNLMLGNAGDSIKNIKSAIHYLLFAPYW